MADAWARAEALGLAAEEEGWQAEGSAAVAQVAGRMAVSEATVAMVAEAIYSSGDTWCAEKLTVAATLAPATVAALSVVGSVRLSSPPVSGRQGAELDRRAMADCGDRHTA